MRGGMSVPCGGGGVPGDGSSRGDGCSRGMGVIEDECSRGMSVLGDGSLGDASSIIHYKHSVSGGQFNVYRHLKMRNG